MTTTNEFCKICGSSSVCQAYKENNDILRCIKCGTGFLAEQSLAARDPSYYELSDHYGESAESLINADQIRDNARTILKYLKKYAQPSGKLLDIGAHTGIFVGEALLFGFNASGIEPNKRAVEAARAKNWPIRNLKIEDLKEQRSFDIITLLHVLEHVGDPVLFVKKIHTLLKPGGIFVVEVPDFGSYLSRKDKASWKFIAPEHLFYFSKQSLSILLNDQGFKVLLNKRRNGEISFLNIRKLFHYFYGHPLVRNRMLPKTMNKGKKGIKLHTGNIMKNLIRSLLRVFIYVAGRPDHILIIAQKL